MSQASPALAEDLYPEDTPPAQCYLRVGKVGTHAGTGFTLRCLACSWSSRVPVCAIAIRLAQADVGQQPVESALAVPADLPTPAQITAARNYLHRIPDTAQQDYAEEHLLWCLMGRPEGCGPRLRAYGLSLAAGHHLQATVEAQLRLPAPPPPRKRRRRR